MLGLLEQGVKVTLVLILGEICRVVWKRVEHLEATLLLDEICEGLELQLESGHLLPCLLQLIIVGLDLLLRSLILLV